MKKIAMMIAGALCLGAAAYAQDPAQQTPTQTPTQQQAPDSTSIRSSDPAQSPTQSPEATPQTDQQQSQSAVPAYRKDMTQIQPGDVPSGLRSTLERPQFKGWENGAVYSNVDKSVFIVEIKDEVEGRMKAYRFDANGKPITDN